MPSCWSLLVLACLMPAVTPRVDVRGFPASGSAPGLGRPWATRGLFSTPHGQLHYTHSAGSPMHGYGPKTLVLFHAHPRSIAEFKYLLDQLHPSYSFVAFDYFGFGGSDDCLSCNATLNQYVSIRQFAQYASTVLTQLGVKQYVAVGSLKGCAVATRLAAVDERVEALVMANPAHWLSDVEAKIRSYMDFIKHPVLKPDGSHLVAAWNDTSASPGPSDLVKLEEKTLDALRAYFVGWQYVLAELDNNNNTIPELKSVKQKTLLIWGRVALAEEDMFGFKTAQYIKEIEAAVQNKQVQYLEYGNQGMVAQNATYIAGLMDKFLTSA